MKNLFLCCALQLIVGCTTTLTLEGQTVRIVEDKNKYNCDFIGTATGFDTLGATSGHESENALNELRNKAVKLGANAIKIINLQTTFQGTTATGETLKCDFSNEA